VLGIVPIPILVFSLIAGLEIVLTVVPVLLLVPVFIVHVISTSVNSQIPRPLSVLRLDFYTSSVKTAVLFTEESDTKPQASKNYILALLSYYRLQRELHMYGATRK